jgi:serine/threonine-protein kinase
VPRNEPNQRYGSALTVAEDLDRWLRREPIAARPLGPVVKTWRWVRRRPTWAALVVLSIVSCLGLGAGILWHNRSLRAAAEHQHRQAQEALRQRTLARQALLELEELYQDLEARWQPDELQAEPARRAFFQRALHFFTNLAQQAGTDPLARHGKARALARVGKIHHALGAHAEAEKSFREALADLTALVAEDFGNAAYRRDLAGTWLNLGSLLRETMDLAEAERAYQEP